MLPFIVKACLSHSGVWVLSALRFSIFIQIFGGFCTSCVVLIAQFEPFIFIFHLGSQKVTMKR